MVERNDKPKTSGKSRKNTITFVDVIIALCCTVLIIIGIVIAWVRNFERTYAHRVYPTVEVGGVPFGGKTLKEVENYWLVRNEPFKDANLTFTFEGGVASISGTDLALGYDATLSATQAYLVGRSGHWASDFIVKFLSGKTNLTPMFRWNQEVFDDFIGDLSERVNIPVQEALFRFANGRVTAFKPSRDGKQLNIGKTKTVFSEMMQVIPESPDKNITRVLPVDIVKPAFATSEVNSFGIKEFLGRGYSEFAGSIAERIHNVALAAAKLNGVLIKPGETFSFNDAVGDISKTTGFLPAYVIKDGRTVLGDGGGVCQVSTTLFRAALAAGLPIVERHAHAYRVHYYEEAGFIAGQDATVYAPSYDLKFKNNTPGYILIQTKTDTGNLSLTFELYGTGDGRQSAVTDQKVWGEIPPPPDLYQDDPTLPKGTVKQVDWAAWGAKASFHYHVTRNGEVMEDTDFYSNFRPWQAVFLRGTKE